jgi:iron complex transport system ATP-binding protein
MRNGKVAHQGTPDELIHPEILSDIYDMDIAVEIIGGKRIGVYYL